MKKIPKLRFKEFKDDWQREKLYYLSELIKDGTHGTHKDVKNGIFLLSAKDIKDGKIQIQKDCRKISFNDFGKIHKNYILQNKDLLLTIVGTIGEVGMVENYNRNYTFQRSVAIIRLQKQKLNPKYGLQYFKTNIFQTFLKNKTNSSAQAGVYLGELSKIDMRFPSLEEQKKIADFLSAVDVQIDLTGQKLELFEKYKKGIIQKIFSQELRFKDSKDNDYPKWEEKKLGDVGEIITGKTPSTKNEKNWNGEIQFVTPTDINDNKYQKSAQRNVTEEINIKILPIGTIMFTCIASIGKMAISTKRCITNQQINSIIVNKNIYNEYIYYTLLNLVPKIQASQSTTTLPIINKTEFSKFIIKLPCLEEQKKIADFLSSIDNKIEKISDELENLKEFKKGLLQQMFV